MTTMREIIFINKLWSVRHGTKPLVREFFLFMCHRRMDSLTKFIQENQNNPAVDKSFCQKTLEHIRSLDRGIRANEPAYRCRDPGCTSCIKNYIERYKKVMDDFNEKIIIYAYYHGVSDYETTATLMEKISRAKEITPHFRDMALSLVRIYLDYMQSLFSIARSLHSRQIYITLAKPPVDYAIVEIGNVRTALHQAPSRGSLQFGPQARNLHPFCAAVARLHFLIEQWQPQT